MAGRSGLTQGIEILLQACVAVFFIAGGIIGIQGYNSQLSGVMRFLGRHDTLTIVTAVVELVIGIVIALAFVVKFPPAVGGILALAFPILWAIWIALAWFGKDVFKPNFLAWLYGFARDLVVLFALWIVSMRLGESK